MAVKHNIADILVNKLLEDIQEASYSLSNVNISVAVAEVLNSFFAVGVQNIFHTKPFSPVHCINNKRIAYLRVLLDVFDIIDKHSPGSGLILKAIYIKVACASLCINKKRIGELCCKCGLAYAFGAVNNDLLLFADDAA